MIKLSHMYYVAIEGVQSKSPPRCAILTRGLFWAEDNRDRDTWLGRNFLVLPNFLEESKLGVFLRVRIITRDEFYLNDLSIWQSKHLVTKICSSSYCSVNCPPPPLSPQPPIPFLCSEWHLHLILPFSEPLMYVGFLYVQN